jgi:hypothetical protein
LITVANGGGPLGLALGAAPVGGGVGRTAADGPAGAAEVAATGVAGMAGVGGGVVVTPACRLAQPVRATAIHNGSLVSDGDMLGASIPDRNGRAQSL